VYSSVIAPKAWHQICRWVNFDRPHAQPFRTNRNQHARDSFRRFWTCRRRSLWAAEYAARSNGSKAPSVRRTRSWCGRLIYGRVRQADSSQGMSTRAIRFSVEASTHIDGDVLGATASNRPDTRSTANETDRNVHLTGERSAVY